VNLTNFGQRFKRLKNLVLFSFLIPDEHYKQTAIHIVTSVYIFSYLKSSLYQLHIGMTVPTTINSLQ